LEEAESRSRRAERYEARLRDLEEYEVPEVSPQRMFVSLSNHARSH
jgi:hypothetical protein